MSIQAGLGFAEQRDGQRALPGAVNRDGQAAALAHGAGLFSLRDLTRES